MDQLHQCLNQFESLLNQHYKSKFQNAKHEDWYQSTNSGHNDPARRDVKAMLKSLPRHEKEEAKKKFKEREETLTRRMKEYLQFNEQQDQHTFTASLILPDAYDFFKLYFNEYDKRFRGQKRKVAKNDENLKYTLFRFAQLSEHNKLIVMRTEYQRNAGSGELKQIHFNIRVMLQFVRLMLMFKTNRNILRSYTAKSEEKIIWEQEKNPAKEFFPTDIYEFEMIEKVMEISANIAFKFTEFVDSNVQGKNIVKKRNLELFSMKQHYSP